MITIKKLLQISDNNTPKLNTIVPQQGLPQSLIDITGDFKVPLK